MGSDIIDTINSQKITKSVPNCKGCGLPEHVCICKALSELRCELDGLHIHILMHENELKRNTNTSRLIGMLFPESVTYYIWNRVSPPDKLIKTLKDDNSLKLLLYPADSPDHVFDGAAEAGVSKNRGMNLIVLDGTWQETRKMVNRSDYLKTIKRLQIKANSKSAYTLRRNQKEGSLCTGEAVSEVLRLLRYQDCGADLMKATELFVKNYEIGRSG